VIFQHAVAFVKEEVGPEATARKLTEIAYRCGSYDNITCIVVEFHHDSFGNGSRPVKWPNLISCAFLFVLNLLWHHLY
jgi:hypothetical protein